jgi:hypothetical protein
VALVTALSEACADLQPWLAVLETLITEPDTQPLAGRTQPGSWPPWNTQVAYVLTDVHAGVRELEQDFRYQVTGSMTVRGGSDGNTLAAIDAVCRLAEALDQAMADHAARMFSRYITQVMQLPAVDLEEPPQRWPVPCPRCDGENIFVRPRLGVIGCPICGKGHVRVTVSDGVIQWEDGTIT